MRRSGFTLVELMVAAAASSVLLVLLYGSLVFYRRAYTREDESLERGRRSQEVLGLMRDDFVRAEGDVQPELLAEAPLGELGSEAPAVDLLAKARRSVNVINAFVNLKAQKPYLSEPFGLKDAFQKGPTVNGFPTVERDGKNCYYVPKAPPQKIKELIPPVANTTAIVHIPDPFDKPRSEWVVMRKVVGGVASPVVWVYHREKVRRWPAGTLLRWTEQTGVKNVGGEQLVDFHFALKTDWPYADPVPPKRPAPWAFPMKDFATVDLAFGNSKLGADVDPGFEASATFLMGP